MNLARMLATRAEEGNPVKVGIIGAGTVSYTHLTLPTIYSV